MRPKQLCVASRQAGVRPPALAGRPRPRNVPAVAERAAGCANGDETGPCSTSGRAAGGPAPARARQRHAPPQQQPAPGGRADRWSLEQLYLAPLDGNHPFQLVMTEPLPGTGAPHDGVAAAAASAGPLPSTLHAAQQQEQQQQAPAPPGPQPGGGPGGGDDRERSPDFYANVGDAIRTLREDIPLLFDRDLNYSIYRDDVTFRDPRNAFSGLRNYKTIFWSLRFHGRIFFRRLYVEVKRIWQTDDATIRMRWTVHGVPRVPWEAEGTFDGVSQYRLDRQGRIYEHAVDNVILRDPPVTMPWLYGLNLMRAQQQPVPGAFFRPAPPAAGANSGAAAAAAACEGGGAAGGGGGGGSGGGGPQAAQPAGAAGGAAAAEPGWWPALLARFSWVRFYAALLATVRLLQRQRPGGGGGGSGGGALLALQPQTCSDH